jgi:AcrR family transcriptional regulator
MGSFGEAAVAKRLNRGEIRRGKTRAALLKAAHTLMSKRGVDAVSLQEITERADVGAGTLYNHFTSRDEIARGVLDCHIHNLTFRQAHSVGSLKLSDPLAVIAVSARSCVRELTTNPLWFWWLQRPDLLVDRMRLGFRQPGLRDLAAARKAGTVKLPGKDLDAVWSTVIWLLIGGARDIAAGLREAGTDAEVALGILQALGVDHEKALRLSRVEPPPYPPRDDATRPSASLRSG